MARYILTTLLVASSLCFASPSQRSYNGLALRQTCPTCILGGNPLVKLVKELVLGDDGQTTDDCRHERVMRLPEEIGGDGEINGLIRVNFEDDRLACSAEGVSRFDDQNTCVAGSCEITEVTDTSALVTYGACIIKPGIIKADGQAITEADCIPTSGQIRFMRDHDSETCGDSETISTTVAARNGDDFTLLETFIGGVVTVCSTV